MVVAVFLLTSLVACGGGGGGGGGGSAGPTTQVVNTDNQNEQDTQDPEPEPEPEPEVTQPDPDPEPDPPPSPPAPQPQPQPQPPPQPRVTQPDPPPPAPKQPQQVVLRTSAQAIACEKTEGVVTRGTKNCIEQAFATLGSTAKRSALAGKLFYYERTRSHADQVKAIFESVSPGTGTDFQELFNTRGDYVGAIRDQYIKTPKDSLINVSQHLVSIARGERHAGAITRAQLAQHGCIIASTGNDGEDGPLHGFGNSAKAYLKASLAQSEACVLFVAAHNAAQTGTIRSLSFRSNGCAEVEDYCLHTKGAFTATVKSAGKADRPLVLLGTSFAAPYASEIIAQMWSHLPDRTIREIIPMVKDCVYGFVGTAKQNQKVPGERLDLGCLVRKVDNPPPKQATLRTSAQAIACEKTEGVVTRGTKNCIEQAFATLGSTAKRSALAGKLFYIESDREHADQVKAVFESISPGTGTDFQMFRTDYYAAIIRDQYIKTPKDSLVIGVSRGIYFSQADSHPYSITRTHLAQHGCFITATGNSGFPGPLYGRSPSAKAYIKTTLAQSEVCILYVAAHNAAQTGTINAPGIFQSDGCAEVEDYCLHTKGSFTAVVKSAGKADRSLVLLGTSFAAPYASEIIAQMWSHMPDKKIREVIPMVKDCVYGFVGTAKQNQKVPGGRLDLGCLVKKVREVTTTETTSQTTGQSASFARSLLRPEQFGALFLPGSSGLTQTLGLEGDSLSYEHSPSVGGAFAPAFLDGQSAQLSKHWGLYLEEATGEVGASLKLDRLRLQASTFSKPDFFGGGGTGIYELDKARYQRRALILDLSFLDLGALDATIYQTHGTAKGLNSIHRVSGREKGFQLRLRQSAEHVEFEGTLSCSRFAGGRIDMREGTSFAIEQSPNICEAGLGFFVPFSVR